MTFECKNDFCIFMSCSVIELHDLAVDLTVTLQLIINGYNLFYCF